MDTNFNESFKLKQNDPIKIEVWNNNLLDKPEAEVETYKKEPQRLDTGLPYWYGTNKSQSLEEWILPDTIEEEDTSIEPWSWQILKPAITIPNLQNPSFRPSSPMTILDLDSSIIIKIDSELNEIMEEVHSIPAMDTHGESLNPTLALVHHDHINHSMSAPLAPFPESKRVMEALDPTEMEIETGNSNPLDP